MRQERNSSMPYLMERQEFVTKEVKSFIIVLGTITAFILKNKNGTMKIVHYKTLQIKAN